MCHNYAKHFFTFIFLFTTASPVFAQLTNNNSRANGENSPYSRYGIGEMRSGSNMMLRQMGGASTAYANPFAVNSDNPASYSFIRLTTYEGAAEGSRRSYTSNGQRYASGMATLSYLTVGIPIGNNGGLAFGLRPHSRTRYYVADTSAAPGMGKINENYLGDGGLNYGYIGGAYKFHGLSLGFNFGYLFGTVEQSNSIVGDSAYVYATAIQRAQKMGGIYWKTGLQYETKLKEGLMLRLGATATLSQNLNVTRNENWLSYSVGGTGTLNIQDTVYTITNQKTNITLPASYSFGAQLAGRDNWSVSLDVNMAQWNQFRKFGEVDSMADNAFRAAVGGEYTPDPKATRNYFQRVTYRLGFYYGTDPVRLRNTELGYYAVTGGLSLPFRRATDRIHLMMEVGGRGTKANGLVKETFVRFGVGLTFNDRWFIKRKYE